MKIKNILSVLILVSGLLISGLVIAQTPPDITYPVPELGNCESKTACKQYCDNPSHTQECLAFAKEHKMMSEEEVDQAKSMLQAIKDGGPGGCQSKTECQAYCEHTAHLDECIAFSEEHDLIPEKELERVKAMAEAHKRGVTPPGNCQTKTECKNYCEKTTNIEECLKYAEEAGFTPPGDVKKARRIVRLMNLGKTPGGCQSKAECENYCQKEEHVDECLEFSVETGEMTKEEAEKIKERQKGPEMEAGPGGCRSDKECETYCNSHQRECLIFAKEHGLMTEEETKMIEKDLAQLKTGIEEASPEAAKCIDNKLGEATVQKIKSGEYIPGPETGQKINQCMKQHEEKMAQEFANSIKESPEIVSTCLKQKFGQEKFNKFQNGQLPQSSEEADLIESCFQKGAQMSEKEMEDKLTELNQALQNASSETINCLNQVRNEFAKKVQTGEYTPAPEEAKEIFKCFEEFSSNKSLDDEGRQKEMSEEDVIQIILNKVPEEAKECVKNNLTQDIIETMKTKEPSENELKSIMEKCVGSMKLDKKEPPEGEKPPEMKQKPPEGEMAPDKQKPIPDEEKMIKDDNLPPKDAKPQPEED